MTIAVAFDIYGTLINPHGVVDELTRHLDDRAQAFSNVWRDKQLEYSFRRGLMQRYVNFPICTRQALDYTDSLLQTGLDDSVKESLMQLYRKLPAFDDVQASLQALSDQGLRLFFHDCQQPVPHHLKLGRGKIGHGCTPWRSMRFSTRLPAPSIWAAKSRLTNVVVCGSTIKAGPLR